MSKEEKIVTRGQMGSRWNGDDQLEGSSKGLKEIEIVKKIEDKSL